MTFGFDNLSNQTATSTTVSYITIDGNFTVNYSFILGGQAGDANVVGRILVNNTAVATHSSPGTYSGHFSTSGSSTIKAQMTSGYNPGSMSNITLTF